MPASSASRILFSTPTTLALSMPFMHCSFSGEIVQCFADQSEDGPIVHWSGSDALVEIDGRLVPVEHRPLHPPASALLRQAGEMSQQRFSVAAAAHLRLDEEILEIDSGLAEERGVVVKEEGKADLFPGDGDEDHFVEARIAEQRTPQAIF